MDSEAVATARIMFEFLSETATAKSKEEILGSLDRSARYFGFDCFAISGIPLATERIDSYFMLNGWPLEWFEHYLSKNYVHADPVIQLCKMQDGAFVWSEALRGQDLGRHARRVMNEAREFKMKDGYSVPLHTASGFQAIVTFGAEKVDLSSAARGALHILSIYAHNALRGLIAKEASPRNRSLLRITAREREIIQWCAAGKTAFEIAEILGRSHRTIQNEILNVQRKLDVVNAAQMIAESFRVGILR
ncbi:LuxR family transcriptional regulator [Rhizobium calliandrae]|uniref:LuxR family transcriptional regulator n=1 Tax=Rhizobium calliandrae TaxID=1312182 RepID=A0ABT7KRW9_9HYPH|nr:LuxR family transcriptional regulator [Rhizobium calliandrae]MDL2410823.1 LuxR family transcriptional regulator [Rhizobium calliandrae]